MFTLSDLIKQAKLSEDTIISQKSSVNSIEIIHLAVIEPPVENFVKNQDIVLTTAMGCTEDDEKFLNFIKEIYLCGASALLISFKPEDKDIPECVVNFAETNKFPIVRLPWSYHFSDIIDLVHKGIFKSQQDKKSIYVSLQNKLIKSYLGEESIDTACRIIGNEFDSSVKIFDRTKKEKGIYMLSNCVHKYSLASEIIVNGSLYGYIYISGIKKTDKDLVSNYLSIPLSLWFNKEEVINLTSLRIKNDFLWQLTNFDDQNKNRIFADGDKMGFDLSLPYVCIVTKPIYKYNQFEYQQNSPKYFNINTTESIIIEECASLKTNVLITANEELFLIYANIYSYSDINKLINNINVSFSINFPEYDFYWGIGDTTAYKYDFNRQYKKARLALNQCINSNVPSRILTYKESRITSLMYICSENTKLTEQAQEVLNCLIKNDSENDGGMDLMQTLSTFLKCNYNSSLTARELHLHRQSLLYRLEKIEQLTGFNLSNHDDLFLLEFYSRLISKFQ